MQTQPVDLRVEHTVSPSNVPADAPRFSWRVPSAGRQSAYRVLVARSEAGLTRNVGELWDSGKVVSGDSVAVTYEGIPLAGDTTYAWKVRVWDEADHATEWSDPATFSTAPGRNLAGEWIGYQRDGGDSAGFRTRWRPSTDDIEEWVQVDLGGVTEFRSVELFPATPITGPTTPDGVTVGSSGWDIDGRFGCPDAVRVIGATEPEFQESQVLADVTIDDTAFTADPHPERLVIDVGTTTARYVRVVATDPWVFDPDANSDVDTQRDLRAWSTFALAALAVRNGDGADRAVDRPVQSSSSVESGAWGRDRLVDGTYESGFAAGSAQLRTEFDLSGTIERARAHVAGLGYSELYVNGKRVGDAVLDPAWTDYRRRVPYTTHDVTDVLAAGDNAVGLWLGRGWFSKGAALWTSLGSPRGIVHITVEYTDGRTRQITSGSHWRAADGPIVENDIYDGEVYDARKANPGWTEPGFDDAAWGVAAPVDPPTGRLWPQQGPPIRRIEVIEPTDLIPHEDGPIVDFGQNHTGWVKLSIEGADAGDAVRIRHAEALTEEGALSTTDLREADATDVYIARGDDREAYEPRFTYHGYRYVQLSGYPGELTAEAICSQVVHTDIASIGSFACGNEDLDRVQRAARWGLRSNAHSVPTDCPQRDERFGWTGDAQLAARALMYNFDVRGFHEKWLRDHDDAQTAAGYLPPVVPMTNALTPADPSWTVTRVVIPWYLYLHYGDESVLESHYDGMRRYVDYWHSVANDGIVPENYGDYGDWLALENNDGSRGLPFDLFNTAHHYQTTRLFGEIADVLGYGVDADRYARRAGAVARAFNDRFLDPETPTYRPDTQAASAIPLFYGIAPADLADEIATALASKVRDAGGTLRTGFLGTRALIHALAEFGHADTAYRVVSQPDQPGWVYMVTNGATTVWERWDSDQQVGSGMNSLNHSPLTLVSEWFYRVLAGIRFDRAFASDRRVTIAPAIIDELEWAGGSVETPYGEVSSRWEHAAGTCHLTVTVPWNVTAAVRVPSDPDDSVWINDALVWDGEARSALPDGVTEVRSSDGAVTAVVAPGPHEIRVE